VAPGRSGPKPTPSVSAGEPLSSDAWWIHDKERCSAALSQLNGSSRRQFRKIRPPFTVNRQQRTPWSSAWRRASKRLTEPNLPASGNRMLTEAGALSRAGLSPYLSQKSITRPDEPPPPLPFRWVRSPSGISTDGWRRAIKGEGPRSTTPNSCSVHTIHRRKHPLS
jgi:hypothetical protein